MRKLSYDEPRPGDVVRLLSDSSRARKLLQFKPTVALRDGLVRLRDWYASLRARRPKNYWSGKSSATGSLETCPPMPPKDFVPVARPLLGQEEVAAASRAILSGWVTQGPEVAAFEKEFAAFVGAQHACAVSSGTTALHLALLAVGVRPGDEVITVSHSYIATANSIRYCGAKPVFVDIDPATFNIDPRKIEPAISELHESDPVRPPDGNALRPEGDHRDRAPDTTFPWWKTRPAPSAVKSCGKPSGRKSASRMETLLAFHFTRENCSPPATAAC